MCALEIASRVGNRLRLALAAVLILLFCVSSSLAESVTLVWDPSPDINVVGYNVYYGTVSRSYTQKISSGSLTSVTISNLTPGVTYYFAATAHDSWGLESDFSEETSYTVPFPILNHPPTLDPLSNIALQEGAAQQTVSLTGISSGSPAESQALTVRATSSNPALIPNPSITYVSPATTGTLTLRPAAFMSGTATITVVVDDGGVTNKTVHRSFNVTVTPVNDAPTLAAIPSVTLSRGTEQHVVSLTGISSGATNEVQTLTVSASSSNPDLIPNPVVNYSSPAATGTLTLHPGTTAGSALISVTVSDGQAQNGSSTRSFNVIINDPPSISDIPHKSIALGSNLPPVSFTVYDLETAPESLVVFATSSNPALIPDTAIAIGGSGSIRSVAVTPVPGQVGTAMITVSVSDGMAVAQCSFQLAVQERPSPPTNMRFAIEGEGEIIPKLAETLVVGQSYTLTAVPAAGHIFAGWSGTLNSSDARVSFVATSSNYLKAKFIPNPFLETKGTYKGLFYEQSARQESSGFFALQANQKGKYSGFLQIGKKRFPFSGRFDADGNSQLEIPQRSEPAIKLSLALGMGESVNTLSGQVAGTNWLADLKADRVTFHARTNPAPWLGKYTIVIPGDDTGTAPSGHSYGTVKITANGTVIYTMKMADGMAVSRTTSISQNGAIPLYSSMYQGTGSVLTWLQMEARLDDDLHGFAQWHCPSLAKDTRFTNGFTHRTEMAGSIYTLPEAGAEPALTLADGLLRFSGLEGEFINPVQLSSNHRLTNLGQNLLTFTLAPGTGLFRGKVADPTTGEILKFGGCLFQKQGAGYGFYAAETRTGRVTLY